MNPENINIYKMNDEKEKSLFKNALIFFDTSSLLDFYYFSEHARKEIFQKVFEALKNRLWIAAQTEYEFLKNREKVFLKPIDAYDNLCKKTKGDKQNNDSGHLEEIDGIIKSILEKISKDLSGQIKTLKEKTSKNDKHPYLEGTDFDNFDEHTKTLEEFVLKYQTTYKNFQSEIEKKIEKQKSSLKATLSKDAVLEAFGKHFKATKSFSYSETLEIVTEGNLRYKNQIPPGYLDEKEKLGFQKFGDLILWKQIIAKGKEEKKDIILVINDVKEDWWYYSDKGSPVSPRHELIKELFDEAGCNFWMYKIGDFLHKSQQFIDSTIKDNTIKEAQDMVQPKQSNLRKDLMDWIVSYFKLRGLQIHTKKTRADLDYSFLDSSEKIVGLQCHYIESALEAPLHDLSLEMNLMAAFFSARMAERYIDELVLVFETPDHSRSLSLLEHIRKFEYNKGTIRLIIISKDINNILTTFYDSLIEPL